MPLLKLFCITLLLAFSVESASSKTVTVRDDLAVLFTEFGTTGTFAVLDTETGDLTLVNESRARQRMIPASTFKIANSLIALETSVIADENEIIPYGGKPQFLKAWEKDMSLQDAIKVSNVPVYQELARRIGLENYQHWLSKFEYGNEKPGEDVETFWLKGPLAISAVEQVRFLGRLAQTKLPVSQESQQIVQHITRLGRRGDSILHGKTGWTTTPDPDIGWFVGWIANQDSTHAFALNIDMQSRADAGKRKMLAIRILNKLGIY